MSGNFRKLVRNKRHGRAHSSHGGISDMVRTATNIEEAAWAGVAINKRVRREREEARLARRRKVTLPEFKCLKDPE